MNAISTTKTGALALVLDLGPTFGDQRPTISSRTASSPCWRMQTKLSTVLRGPSNPLLNHTSAVIKRGNTITLRPRSHLHALLCLLCFPLLCFALLCCGCGAGPLLEYRAIIWFLPWPRQAPQGRHTSLLSGWPTSPTENWRREKRRSAVPKDN